MCFPKNKLLRSQSAGLAKVPSEENNPQELYGRSRRELPGWQQRQQLPRSSSAAAAAPGPAAPGRPSRVTHGHGAGWEGVKSAFLLSQPGSDSHLLPSQVLIKQEENAPAWMYIDNYVATHGRVSSEWRPRWSRRGRTARVNSSTRAAGAGSRAAETRAQGHLTSWEPKRKPGAASRGSGALGPGGRPPRPLGAQAAGASGQWRVSGRIVCGSSVLLSCLRLPPSPPSPPLRRRLRLVPGRGRVLPLLRPGMVSSRSFVSPPPPLFSPKRRSRLLSSPLKPTWRRRRRQLPERKSGTRAEHGPSSQPPPPPPPPLSSPPLPAPRTPSASLRRPPSSIMGSVVYAVVGGGRPNASSLDSLATPLLATVARKGKRFSQAAAQELGDTCYQECCKRANYLEKIILHREIPSCTIYIQTENTVYLQAESFILMTACSPHPAISKHFV